MIGGVHGIHCMPCSSQIISEMLPIIHTMEKFDFLKSTMHSQIIHFSVFHKRTTFVTACLILLASKPFHKSKPLKERICADQILPFRNSLKEGSYENGSCFP